MTRAALLSSMASVAAEAAALAARATSTGFGSTAEAEASINSVRAELAELLPLVDAEWGVDAIPALRAGRALAARLLDLRAQVADTTETLTETLSRDADLITLAVGWYGDAVRWTELLDLNPNLATPARIAAGASVVRRAR